MGRLIVVVPLKEGKKARALELLRKGPPFDLEGTSFDQHVVHLTDREAVFVFEGASTLELPAENAELWRVAEAWRECLADKPRIADTAFSWQRVDRPEGVSFEPTPGVGDSEGGGVYSPR